MADGGGLFTIIYFIHNIQQILKNFCLNISLSANLLISEESHIGKSFFSNALFFFQGKGGMAVSNSIGSNTFDILICLGVPWFIRALFTGFHDEIWFVGVQSDALAYTVVSLLISLIVLYCILVASRFVLSRTLGIICLAIYAVFLTISLLFELNVFYPVNLPTCIVDTNLDKYYN